MDLIGFALSWKYALFIFKMFSVDLSEVREK